MDRVKEIYYSDEHFSFDETLESYALMHKHNWVNGMNVKMSQLNLLKTEKKSFHMFIDLHSFLLSHSCDNSVSAYPNHGNSPETYPEFTYGYSQ